MSHGKARLVVLTRRTDLLPSFRLLMQVSKWVYVVIVMLSGTHRYRYDAFLSFACMQDPTNEAKRIYKVFDSIEDTREEEEVTGSALKGRAKVAANKAVRSTVEAALTTKAASSKSGADGLDLFGGLDAMPEQKSKKNKKNPAPKVKKEVTPEEKAKKNFNTDLTKLLDFKLTEEFLFPCFFHRTLNYTYCICKLRLQDLANKARATATRLTESGVQHQEVSIVFDLLPCYLYRTHAIRYSTVNVVIQLYLIYIYIHANNLLTYASFLDIQQVFKSWGLHFTNAF